jgi:hypothetical protein
MSDNSPEARGTWGFGLVVLGIGATIMILVNLKFGLVLFGVAIEVVGLGILAGSLPGLWIPKRLKKAERSAIQRVAASPPLRALFGRAMFGMPPAPPCESAGEESSEKDVPWM